MDDSIYANFKYGQIICHNLEALVFDSFHKTGVKKKRMFRIKLVRNLLLWCVLKSDKCWLRLKID